MKLNGWNQADLVGALKAQGVDVRIATVSRWATGRTAPSHRQARAILDAFGVANDERLMLYEALGAE